MLPRQTQLNAWMRLANQRMPVKTMAGIWRGFILGRTQRAYGEGKFSFGKSKVAQNDEVVVEDEEEYH